MHSTGILTIESKFILVFEKIFFRNPKKCYIPENVKERDVIPQSRPSQLCGAVCKKKYLEQICDIFSLLEIITVKLPENLFINKTQNLSHDM